MPLNKAQILEEIRRTAKANGGAPLGSRKFAAETGIRQALRAILVVDHAQTDDPPPELAKEHNHNNNKGLRRGRLVLVVDHLLP